MKALQKKPKRKPYRPLYRIHGQYVDQKTYYAHVRAEEVADGITPLTVPHVYNYRDPALKRTVCISRAEHQELKRKAEKLRKDEIEDPRRKPFFDLVRDYYAGVPILLTDKVRHILEYDPPEFRA